jgi:hypothetical protein
MRSQLKYKRDKIGRFAKISGGSSLQKPKPKGGAMLGTPSKPIKKDKPKAKKVRGQKTFKIVKGPHSAAKGGSAPASFSKGSSNVAGKPATYRKRMLKSRKER